jgi:hypothetical protein
MRISPAKVFKSHLVAGSFLLGLAFNLIGLQAPAQTPASTLTVKLLDPIDSAQAQAGQTYHAAIAKDTTVGGISLAKGADATIVLAPGTAGNRWTLNLVEVTIDGKPVGVNGQNPTVVTASLSPPEKTFASCSARRTASLRPPPQPRRLRRNPAPQSARITLRSIARCPLQGRVPRRTPSLRPPVQCWSRET